MTTSVGEKQYQAYRFLIILLCSILCGALTGYLLGHNAVKLKPLGDIFLNLLFTFVIPLVFFSVSSAIASLSNVEKMWKIIFSMLGVFIFTSLIAAIFMLIVVTLFPPAQGVTLSLATPTNTPTLNLADQLVSMFTVSDFIKLFSRDNMLALIIFSLFIGLATHSVGEKGKPFARFLQAGTEIFMQAISFVMYYAPIGFFAYFAVLIGEMGPELLKTYYRATLIYYLSGSIYFVFIFTFYAYLAAKSAGIKIFWKNAFLPALTALATCSGAASIPANLHATKKIGISAQIYELVVPVGTLLHKDGSVLGGMMKISFLFILFHMNFLSGTAVLLAILISLLVGTVMGAIPSGGLVGEMLILSVYGFPPQTLIMIAAISLIIDPLATLLNVTSNTVCSMLVARLIEGPQWLSKRSEKN